MQQVPYTYTVRIVGDRAYAIPTPSTPNPEPAPFLTTPSNSVAIGFPAASFQRPAGVPESEIRTRWIQIPIINDEPPPYPGPPAATQLVSNSASMSGSFPSITPAPTYVPFNGIPATMTTGRVVAKVPGGGTTTVSVSRFISTVPVPPAPPPEAYSIPVIPPPPAPKPFPQAVRPNIPTQAAGGNPPGDIMWVSHADGSMSPITDSQGRYVPATEENKLSILDAMARGNVVKK